MIHGQSPNRDFHEYTTAVIAKGTASQNPSQPRQKCSQNL
jgi:hypothetical protein